MSKAKRIGISILTILIVACVAVSIWWGCVYAFAPDKLIENTYEVGLQELKDGTTKHFVEVKYNSNENKNGLECLDIKFNYLLDENQEEFYSQGIQIVADERTGMIDWGYYLDEDMPYTTASKGHWYDFTAKVTWYNRFGSYNLVGGTSYYNYASGNDYVDTTISQNEINDDSAFRIQLGEELFQMKFKGATNEIATESNLYGQKQLGTNFLGNKAFDNYYYYYNIYAFVYKLYEGIQSVANGKQSSVVFEFGDMFNYFEYDEEKGDYKNTAVTDSAKVIAKMKSYYSILVYKTADGARKASDSLFNCIHGNQMFNMTGDYTSDDYFIGRSVVKCNLYDFNLISMTEGTCALKLSDEFIQNYEQYSAKICLSICIDLDILKQQGITQFTFASDSGLDKFNVYECYQIEYVDGELVKTGVIV